LDQVIEKASGVSLNQFNNSRLRNKIGMNGLYIPLGSNNVYFSNPRSMARYGLLMLNKGTWSTTKILDDAVYFTAATNSSQALNNAYGYLWWLNGKASFMIPSLQNVFQGSLVPNAPVDMFSALGKNGQIINIVPSQNLVMVRMGNSDGSPVPITFVNEIWKKLNKVICKSTSIRDVESEQFELFPNPSSDKILIRSGMQITDIQVFNQFGQTVSVFLNDRELSIQHLPKGIYFLKTGGVVKRFVKL
jgi:CubicO group peptidase (beta-lactamase class C family)